MDKIKEASAVIEAPIQKVVDKKMPVFYNPVMKLNRDISIMVLNSYDLNDMKIGLPLAGSGIRGIRFIREVDKGKICEIHINDIKNDFKKYMKKIQKMNYVDKFIDEKNIFIHNKDANVFLIENKPFDYIDIDPFGTPNPFLDSAVRSLRSDGILAVTATDTSALCGSYPKACRRKYWAEPLRNELMHEIGLRILIRKVQLMGTNQQRALIPILSYSKDHYMRIFFRFDKGKENMDKVLNQHDYFESDGKKYGPMWIGNLNDLKFLKKVIKETERDEFYDSRSIKLVKTLFEEQKISGFGFYDVHKIAKEIKTSIPKYEYIMDELKKKGFEVSRVHFTDTGLKTTAKKEDIIKIMKKL